VKLLRAGEGKRTNDLRIQLMVLRAPVISGRLIPYYRALLAIRPAQLGAMVKALLFIRRRVIQATTGCVYWIDPVSVFGFTLLSQGCFEPNLTRLVKCLLRPGDTFIDVGGNEGYFSVLAAHNVRDGRVLCVEPQKRLMPVIRRNIQLNEADCVTICNVALSDSNGEAYLFLRPSSNTGASSFFKHWKVGGARQRVITKTMDDLLQETGAGHIRLLKVDCEGAERLVLLGASRTLARQNVDFCVVDYHERICGAADCEQAHGQLIVAGYRLVKFQGLCVYYRPEKRKDLEILENVCEANSFRE
jgi:FkbM family methyltransferase